MTAIDDDAQDRDAFEVDVGFDLDDVADLRVRREQAALDHTAGSRAPACAPRPGAVRRALVSSISIRRGIGRQT